MAIILEHGFGDLKGQLKPDRAALASSLNVGYPPFVPDSEFEYGFNNFTPVRVTPVTLRVTRINSWTSAVAARQESSRG